MLAEILAEGPVEGHINSVACTLLSNGYMVSTIDRGEDTSVDDAISLVMKLTGTTVDDLAEMSPTGFRADLSTPGRYETMVFSYNPDTGARGANEHAFARYMSREEAECGHRDMVEKWRRMDREGVES